MVAAAAAADNGIVVTYGPPQGVPVLAAPVVKGSTVTFTWTLPSGHKSGNIHWSTSSATNPPDSTGLEEGVPMSCAISGPSNGVHDCTGGSDLPGSKTTYAATIAPGAYWAQVDSLGQKAKYVNGSSAGTATYASWSSLVRFTVGAGGGGSSGGTGTSGGSSSGTSQFVSFARTVTIRHADGRIEQKKSTVLVDKDVLASYGNPVSIKLANGRVVLDRQTQLQYTPSGDANWNLKNGIVYLQTKTPTSVGMSAGLARVIAVGRGPFTVQSQFGNQQTVRSYGGDVTVTLTSPYRPERKVTIHEGQQVNALGRDGGTLTRPHPFGKSVPFWK